MAEESAKTQGEEVITVTGSLVERRELTTPSPISVVDREKLAAAGITNLGDILQRLPSQGNALNEQNNNGGDGSVRIDLRSLGTARTLILMNGRRVVPSGLGADDSVDLGTIPLAMIERVEVLKDGASATYGSDAISGVVNIITRQDFNGTEATVYTGTSQRGDGTNLDLSFVTGHSSKTGNITLSAGYQKQYEVMAGDRDFSKVTRSYDFDTKMARLSGSSAVPGGFLDTDPTGDGMTDAIHVPGCASSPGGNCTYDTKTGMWRDFKNATATDFGDRYNFQPENYLFTPSQRINIFSNGHYDVTDNIRAFFEASYNNRKSEQQLAPEPLFLSQFGLTISADSMYNPFGTQGQYASLNNGGVQIDDYNRRLNEFGDRTYKQDVNTSRVVVGLDGKVPESTGLKNWKWEVSYNYGRVDATQTTHGDLILSRLANALGPSMMDPGTGSPICVGTPGDPTTAIPGCVPLSIMIPNTTSKDAINYLTFTSINSGFNEQHTAQAQASGKIVDLPNHGDVSFGIGGDYRHEQGGAQPDPLTATGDTTGNAFEPTEGAYHLFEGYAEVSVVPVSGLEAAQWVEIDAAGRAYDYSNFGSGMTGKLSGLWRTAGGLSFRGTYGNAFRAPSIAELFSGQFDNYVAIEDPCDHMPPSGPKTIDPNSPLGMECAREIGPTAGTYKGNGAPQQRFKNGGNPALGPEKADTITGGIVFEPPALKGLAFTLDYWRINITNAIQTIPPQAVFSNCYQGSGALQRQFCSQIQRDPTTHTIVSVFDLATNVGGVDTSGLDFGASYGMKTQAGSVRVGLEATYLLKYNEDTGQIDPATGKDVTIHGRNFYDLGVLPDLRANVFGVWSHPSGFGAGLNLRYVGGYQECDQDNCNDPMNGRRDIENYLTGDIFLNYTVKNPAGTTSIAVGCNNVNDASPPVIYNGAALNADESAYDFMGRYFYLRLSQML